MADWSKFKSSGNVEDRRPKDWRQRVAQRNSWFGQVDDAPGNGIDRMTGGSPRRREDRRQLERYAEGKNPSKEDFDSGAKAVGELKQTPEYLREVAMDKLRGAMQQRRNEHRETVQAKGRLMKRRRTVPDIFG